ncbi:MAG: Smr/MutS family protein [Thermodesulfobacteriota bacterium]
MDPVHIPIEDVLDLHAFAPKEIPDLLHEYLEACAGSGITRLRLIHGKGTGRLKDRVRNLLGKHPLVVSFQDAAPDSGGWGATVVLLQPGQPKPLQPIDMEDEFP